VEFRSYGDGARTVINDSALFAVPEAETRYEALVRVSQSIGSRHDPKELFGLLVGELNRAVDFDALGVFLKCRNSDRFQSYFISTETRSVLVAEENVDPEEAFRSSVYERQETLLRLTDDIDPHCSWLQTILKKHEIRSICALPLTTAHRRLGVICFGSRRVDAYPKEEVRFLSVAANQIALAFDDASNFAALRRASEELQSKNDRLRLLLDVTNQVVSNLELRDLLRAISHDVRRMMQCDYAALSLPEADDKQLRLYALDFPEGKGLLQEELVYPIEGSLSGEAFRAMKPVTVQSPFTSRLNSPIVQAAVREGLRSLCLLPLVSRNRVRGVLGIGRLKDNGFKQVDVDFLSQVANQIALAVENALAYREIRELKEQLAKEKLYLEDEIRAELNFSQIIGNSPSLYRVLKRVETVAPTDSTVLIHGETGTGKELIARAIHDLSARCGKAFVKLNCAAIPTGLLESELFGHEKGAFTGAIAQRIGRFEVANGGTIFLDEIGEIPLELQPKLLRVLQEREFERLGSSRTLRTDARLIAATNRDLDVMVRGQKFRSDLFFRLNVFPMHIPPLREREGDIPVLVRHFAQQFSRRMNKAIESIPSRTMHALCRYDWPGNIRELQNVIERAVIISSGPTLSLDLADLRSPETVASEEARTPANFRTKGSLRDALQETERQQILKALAQCNWVVAGPNGAAARLGMKRSTLRLRIQKLGISPRSV